MAHTCFFSLELPAYSSASVCYERLLYAVTHCQSIDIDTTSSARENRDLQALSGSDEAEAFLQDLLEGNARRSQSSTAPSSASLEAAIAQLRTLRKQGPDAALASPFDRVSSEVGP